MANSAFTPLILDDKLSPEEKIKRAQKWLQENKYNYNLITSAYTMTTRPPEVEPYLENIKKDIDTYKNVQSAVSQYHNELNAIKAENALKVKAYNDQITTAVEQKRSMEFGRLAKPEKTVYYTDKNGAITRYEEWIKARPEDYTFGAELPKNARIVSHGKNKYVVRTYTIDELGKEINRLSEEQKTRLKTYQNTIGYYSMKEWTPFKNTSPIGRTANALLSEVNKTLVGTALSLTENVATASLVLKNHADLQRQFVNDLVSGKIRDFNDAIGQYGKTWSQAVKLSKIDFPRFALTGSPAVDYLQFIKTHPTSPEGIPQEISMAEEVVQSVLKMIADIALVSGALKAADMAKLPSITEGTTKMASLSYAKRFGGTLAALDAIKTYNSLTGDTLMKKGGMDALDIANAALKTAVSAGLTYALFAIPPLTATSKTAQELTVKQIQDRIFNAGKKAMQDALKSAVFTTPLKLMTINTANIIANYGIDIATGRSTSKTVNEMGAEVLGQVIQELPQSYLTGLALGTVGAIKTGINTIKVNNFIKNIFKEYERWSDPNVIPKTQHQINMKRLSKVLVETMGYIAKGDIAAAKEALNSVYGNNPLKPETYSKMEIFMAELGKKNTFMIEYLLRELEGELHNSIINDENLGIINGDQIFRQLLTIKYLYEQGNYADAMSMWNSVYNQTHPVDFNKSGAVYRTAILDMFVNNSLLKKKLTPWQRKLYREELKAFAMLSYLNDILELCKQPAVSVANEDINKNNLAKSAIVPRMKDVMEPEGTETKPTEGVPIVKVSPETKPPVKPSITPEPTTLVKPTAEQPPITPTPTTAPTEPTPTEEETPEELESNRQLKAVERMIAEKRKEKGLPPKPPTKEPVKPQVSIEKPEVKPEVKSEAKPTISANIPVSSARKLSPEEKDKTNRAFHKVLRDATGGDKEMMKYVKSEIINDITSATRKGEPPVNRMVDMTEEEWGVLNKLLSDERGKLNPIEINEDMHNLLEKNKQKYLKLQEEGGKLNAEEGRARDTEITPQGAPELERGEGQEHDLRYNASERALAPKEGEKKEEIDKIIERKDPEKTKVIPENDLGKEKEVTHIDKKFKIRYALIPLDKVITNYDTEFNPNPEYPSELARISRKKEQEESLANNRIKNWEPTLYFDSDVMPGENLTYRINETGKTIPLTASGRPIVVLDKKGNAITVDGNIKIIMLKKKAKEEGGLNDYEEELLKRLSDYGISSSDVKGKVLVGIYYGNDSIVDLAKTLNKPYIYHPPEESKKVEQKGNMAPQEGEKKEEVEVKKAPAVGNIDEIVERVEPEKTNVIPEENIGKEKKVYKKNKELKIKYALVPLDKVITSHDTDFNPNPEYPQELQNRDRSKTQLKLDTIEKVNKFIPSLYMENEVASDGRPIVVIDKNGRVITLTGNGRLIALKMKAEKEGGLTEYEKELKSRLPEFGLKDQDIKGRVLVGVYYGKDNLVDLARLLNEPETKELSKIEQAVSDAVLLANAKKKGRDVLAKLNEDVSNILSPKNSQFLQLFTEICVGDEAKVRAESGEYTHDFQERVENALFMYVFNNDNRAKSLLSAYREAGETRIKALLNGVMLNLPLISKLRDLIDTYHCMDLDMTPELLGALYDINEIRKSGEKIEDLLYATDIFSEDHIRIPDYKIPLYRALVSIKSNNQAKLFIGGYYSSAMDTLDPHQQTLFSNLPTSRKEFITEYAKEWLETYGKKTYEEAKTAIAKTAVSQEVVGAGKERPPEKVEQKGKVVAKPIKRTVKPVSLEGLKGKRLYQASIHNVLANGGLKRKQIDATIKIIDDVLKTFTKLTDAGIITDENYGDWVSTIVYYPDAPEFNPLTKTKQGEVVKGFFFNIDETGKAGMVFGKNMDVSTMPHEFSHSYELLMQKGAEVSPKVKNMYNLFSHWLGVKPGNWTKEAKEKFANAFMHCLHEGLYRDGEIGEAYEIMERSLKALWKDVKDVEELEIPDYIRDLYNIIFGTKTYEQVFDNEIRDLIKKETQFIPENATRGSPFRAPHFKVKPVNKSTSIVEYTPKTKGYTTTTFIVKKIDGGYIVDGIVCRTPEDIQRRLAEIIRDFRDVFDYRKVFQSNDAEVNKRLNDAQRQQKENLKQLKDDLNALYASVTKSRLNLEQIRTALIRVVGDLIIREFGIDPNTPEGQKAYRDKVKFYTGQTSLSKASTFTLIKLLDDFEPGVKDVVFGSSFFKVLPEVVNRAQKYLGGEYDEETILKAIFTGVFEYPSSKNKRPTLLLYWLRAPNAFIYTMGQAGVEVIERASEAKKWREEMLYNGMRIINEMERIFNNYQNCNAHQEPYDMDAQRGMWRIIIDAIEKVDPNLEGDAKLQAQYKMIEKGVEENNNKASQNVIGYSLINLEDVNKIFELTKEFTDYFGHQIDRLNNEMGEIIIGKQPNYIIRVIVNSLSQNWGLNIHPETGRITMYKPPSVLSREEEEEVGTRELNMVKLLRNYLWGMSQYIANYKFVQFINYELPFKVPQNFNWGQYLVPWAKNYLSLGAMPDDISHLLKQGITVLVNNVLSYNLGMVALNYVQRFLSFLFVEPKVFRMAVSKLNPLNAKMSKEDLEKYPYLRELMTMLATGGKSIFMESVEDFNKFNPYLSAHEWVNLYGKLAKICGKILEKSPFMFFEEGNWTFGYFVGALQSIINSETFKARYSELRKSGMKKRDAFWQAVNDALANPVVFKNALSSAQVVNAATNVDPSSVYSPLIFGKNNVLSPLLVFWRFTVNMGNIFILDIFNKWSLKNPYSRSYVDIFFHGKEQTKQTTEEVMVLYNILNSLSRSNFKNIFRRFREKRLGGLTEEEAEKIGDALKDAIKKREKVLKDTDKYAKQLLTGKLTGQRLLEFLGYMVIEFLLTYVYSVLRQAQRKSIGQYLIKPENRKAFLGKVVPKREIRKAVLNSVNIAKMISPKSIGTGIFPEVNIYNTTEWKSIVRALLRWGTTVAIPPLSLVDINLRTATGASLEEIIYYNCIYEKKRK